MSISDLQKIHGLGKALPDQNARRTSRRIARARFSETVSFHDPASVSSYYMETLRHEEQEVLLLVMLNSKGKLIRDEVISKGTVRASLISPREIFIEAVRHQAVSILLLHNHPSGIPDPSRDDVLLTERSERQERCLALNFWIISLSVTGRPVSMRAGLLAGAFKK